MFSIFLMESPKAKNLKPERQGFHTSHHFSILPKTTSIRLSKILVIARLSKKMFRANALTAWDILEKEMVDEIIFKVENTRDRLMLELMARGGMRIGEVLKLTHSDVYGRKLIIRDPKGGREKEFIFIPQKIADRLKDYIRENGFQPEDRIFPICYETARSMAK